MAEIKIVKKVLEANDAIAENTRKILADKNVFMFNIMGAPGCGKTTLLEALLDCGFDGLRVGVVEGDIATTIDAERLSRFNIPIVQINTEVFGGDCSLAPNLVQQSILELPLDDLDVILVENVGNLVCPAEFDIGQDIRVVVISVAEGEEKPVKYPLMFRVSNLAVITKIDIAEVLEFDTAKLVENIKNINPYIPIHQISSRKNTNVEKLRDWMVSKINERS